MTLYTLALQFDVNQGTQSLQYHFSNPEVTDGALAGTFNFNGPDNPKNDDTLQVSLKVTGNAADSPSVSVKDCTLVSVNNGKLGPAFLSPFSENKAVSKIKGLSVKEVGVRDGRVELFGLAKKQLPVVADEGQWQISGYLSAVIELNGKSYNRIFTFDPEGTAGGGSTFP
ncbi:MAG: hypothetical protein ABJO36_05630 [Litorimonas sp.]